MHEHGFAKGLWPQLQRIAHRGGFRRVTRVDMTVGVLHGVSAEFLRHSFEHAFEGSNFEGATMDITIVEPGDGIIPPGRSEPTMANGWELLITRIEGEE